MNTTGVQSKRPGHYSASTPLHYHRSSGGVDDGLLRRTLHTQMAAGRGHAEKHKRFRSEFSGRVFKEQE